MYEAVAQHLRRNEREIYTLEKSSEASQKTSLWRCQLNSTSDLGKKKSKNNHHSFRFLSFTSIYIKTLYCTFFPLLFAGCFSCFSSWLASCYLELVRREEENRKALEPAAATKQANQFKVIQNNSKKKNEI